MRGRLRPWRTRLEIEDSEATHWEVGEGRAGVCIPPKRQPADRRYVRAVPSAWYKSLWTTVVGWSMLTAWHAIIAAAMGIAAIDVKWVVSRLGKYHVKINSLSRFSEGCYCIAKGDPRLSRPLTKLTPADDTHSPAPRREGA